MADDQNDSGFWNSIARWGHDLRGKVSEGADPDNIGNHAYSMFKNVGFDHDTAHKQAEAFQSLYEQGLYKPVERTVNTGKALVDRYSEPGNVAWDAASLAMGPIKGALWSQMQPEPLNANEDAGGMGKVNPASIPAINKMGRDPDPTSTIRSAIGSAYAGYASGGNVDKALDVVGQQQEDPVAVAKQVVVSKKTEPMFFAGSPEYTNNLQNWFGGSHEDLKEKNGAPKKLYVGTIGDFDKFNRKKMNIESDHGAGFYASNSIKDVNANYAGEGPDLRGKINRYIDQNFQDDITNPDTGEDYTHEEMREMAKDALGVKHLGAVMPVYITMKKPVVLGGKNESFFDFEHPYDEKTDEYGEPKGHLVNIINGIREAASEFDLSDHDVDDIISTIHEHAMDRGGIHATDLEQIVKKGAGYAYDPDSGDSATNEIWRSALQHAGHDGIIDHTVDDKFGSNRRGFAGARIPGMEGVTPETTHYIAFHPEQIKSAVGNRGTFDPKETDIRKSEGGDVEKKKNRRQKKLHPALNIPGVHIRTAEAGEPFFHGEK